MTALERVNRGANQPACSIAEEAFEQAVWAERRMNELLADPMRDERGNHTQITEMRGYRSGCLAILAYATSHSASYWLDEVRAAATDAPEAA